MIDKPSAVAQEIVRAILTDLHGRKGIGNELEEIDGYVYNDMQRALTDDVVDPILRKRYPDILHF